MKDLDLGEVIVGRVEPHIYAFTTNTIPNYLKVGDTYRTVKSRLEEWKKYFPNLKLEFEGSAQISDDVFFRDFAVHGYLENNLHKERLTPIVLKHICPTAYYSKEFFKNATVQDMQDALQDIKKSFDDNDNKYNFYNLDRMPVIHEYTSTGYWAPRPNQQATIDKFKEAVGKGRTNLLMYAVMRFGKSFTSLCCAKEINAKIVLVVSAKSDVKEEWRKNVQSAENFRNDYMFADAKQLRDNENLIRDTIKEKGIVLFLTLQDLQGTDIKEKHKEVFDNKIDLLIVDETHYGARAEKYGAVLRQIKDIKNDYSAEEFVDAETADKQIKALNAKITLHLSGTPYRILMGGEFAKDDIIAFYQFTDIVKAQEEWENTNISKDEFEPEWNNPYYGFPQMIRFAFHPSSEAKAKLDELRKNGVSYAFSELFRPKSIACADDGSHKLFVHEEEILDLFEVIDGSKKDKNVLGFLNYEKIKTGNMCRHIVCVLPYCASCDALEKLIRDNTKKFKNLNEYEIINISGVDSARNYRDVKDVKRKIKECEANNKKTLTLTVNRMLTGSTVEEWDTMIFLKDTASPQDYDQAIFRLQNQYVRKYKDPKTGQEIKYNMKPQTLLVDFDPDRMFVMQESKSQIYNMNTEVNGNAHLQDRIREELRISPIITINRDKICRVEAIDIIDAVSKYSSKRGVWDESKSLPVDFELLNDQQIFDVINSQGEIGSNRGLKIEGSSGEETDLDLPSTESDDPQASREPTAGPIIEKDDMKSLENKFKTYYSRILFFAFLTKNRLSSLDDILACIENEDNLRIATNLNLKRHILSSIRNKINSYVLQQLDYKIFDINKLAHDERVDPIQRAETALIKFGRFSESEVPTPINVCDDMIKQIPDDAFFALATPDSAILDIASKAGEFAIAICVHCQRLGIAIESIKNSVLSIPTSSVAYEFTRKVYEILGLSVDAIAANFNSYGLLEVKRQDQNGHSIRDIDYEKIKRVLSQNKPLATINLDDNIPETGENIMQFQAVVGNPPYQVDDGGNGASAKPLYNLFIEQSQVLTSRLASLLTPSRWFAGGKGLETFRENMLRDRSIVSIVDYPNPKDCFPELNISGGVSYFLWDKNYDGECAIINVASNTTSKKVRPLNEFDVFVRYNDAVDIIHKIVEKEDVYLNSIVSSRKPFGLNSYDRGLPRKMPNSCKMFSSKGEGYIHRGKICQGIHLIDQYKVIIGKALSGHIGETDENGQVRVLARLDLLKPAEVCTESYLCIGGFDSIVPAKNLETYLKTKFARFLLLQALTSMNITKDKFCFVPVQDFSSKSDIDWSKSIAEIDQQLYKKYGLDKKEIDFIESMIKPME